MILPLGQLAYLFCSKALLVKDIGEKKKSMFDRSHSKSKIYVGPYT